jgi:hypothetical protein
MPSKNRAVIIAAKLKDGWQCGAARTAAPTTNCPENLDSLLLVGYTSSTRRRNENWRYSDGDRHHQPVVRKEGGDHGNKEPRRGFDAPSSSRTLAG